MYRTDHTQTYRTHAVSLKINMDIAFTAYNLMQLTKYVGF